MVILHNKREKRFDEEQFKIWHALLVYKKVVDVKHTPFTNCRLALAFFIEEESSARDEYVMIGHLLMI